MKIYSKIKFRFDTGAVISETSCQYDGPVAECKGGGKSETTTVDPVYNAGLLKLSQEQQEWARQMFNMFKYGTTEDLGAKVTGYWDKNGKFIEGSSYKEQPLEKIDMSKAPPQYTGADNTTLNPKYTEWVKSEEARIAKVNEDIKEKNELGKQNEKKGAKYVTLTREEILKKDPTYQGNVSEMQYLQNIINSNNSLLGLQTNVQQQLLESQLRLMPKQEKLTEAKIQELIEQTGLTRAQIQAQLKILPEETNLTLEEIAARRQLLPQQTNLTEEQIRSQLQLLPKETGLTLAQIKAQRHLLPYQTGLEKDRLRAQREALPLKSALYKTTMEDINKGIDVDERMDQAQASVQHAFKNTNETNRMDIASYGLDPTSGRYASQNRAARLAESAGIAGARTEAQNYAEQEDFSRKVTGLGLQI